MILAQLDKHNWQDLRQKEHIIELFIAKLMGLVLESFHSRRSPYICTLLVLKNNIYIFFTYFLQYPYKYFNIGQKFHPRHLG